MIRFPKVTEAVAVGESREAVSVGPVWGARPGLLKGATAQQSYHLYELHL